MKSQGRGMRAENENNSEQAFNVEIQLEIQRTNGN
jgi:hypothetical protein